MVFWPGCHCYRFGGRVGHLAILQQARPLQVQNYFAQRNADMGKVSFRRTSVADLSTALSLPIEVVPLTGGLIEPCVAKEERRE